MKSELKIYNNHRYRRYPNSKYRNHRSYFYGTEPRRGYLHRHIWEDNNGEIPDGYEIHHKDHNTLNNNIDNLECVNISEHRSNHLSQRSNTDEHKKHLVKARQKASEWFKSEKGREWRSDFVKSTWSKRKRYDKVCEHCGSSFITPFPSRAKYCNKKCQYNAWYNRTKCERNIDG